MNKTYAILLIEVYLEKITSLNLKRHSLFLKFIQTTGLIVFMKTTYQDIKKRDQRIINTSLFLYNRLFYVTYTTIVVYIHKFEI